MAALARPDRRLLPFMLLLLGLSLTATAQAGAVRNVRPPSITGDAEQGRQLEARPGHWRGATRQRRYQWSRCTAGRARCRALIGATKPTRSVARGDIGHRLRVTVRAHARAGRWHASRSRMTAPVTARTPGPDRPTWPPPTPAPTPPTPANTVSISGLQAGRVATGNVAIGAQVGGAAPDRVEFSVDGQLRRTDTSAPYAYTWHTRAEANGSHTFSVRRSGPGAAGALPASATVTVTNRSAYPPPTSTGPETMYAEFAEGDEATANNLLDDVWPARGFALPRLGWPLEWTEDPYTDAYWRFFHYSLRPEQNLMFMWQTSGQRRYLDKLIAVLRSYSAYDAVRPVNTLTFDNKHASAYRTMALVSYYGKLAAAGELPDDLATGLRASLTRLGVFLAKPANFEARTTTASTKPPRCCCSPTTTRTCPAPPDGARSRWSGSLGCSPRTSIPTASTSRTRPSTTCTYSGSSTRSPSGRSATNRRLRRRTAWPSSGCCATPRT